MSSSYTVLDIINYYESLFQDEHNRWLDCGCNADIRICRCLDAIQLDLAFLWLSKPRIKYKFNFDCITPYIVNVYADNRSENNQNISWCPYSSNGLKLVGPREIPRSTISKTFGEDVPNLTEQGCLLLFALLGLYKVNTNIQRKVLTEFYFISCPRAFNAYIDSFCNELPKKTDCLKRSHEHIQMIKKVLAWYAQSNEEKENTFQYLKSNLFKPLSSRTMCIDESTSSQRIDNLCNLLYKMCIEPLKKNTFSLNYQLVNNIYNIFREIKKPNNKLEWKEMLSDFNNIYFSLNKIVEQNRRSDEPDLKKTMDNLHNLIQK